MLIRRQNYRSIFGLQYGGIMNIQIIATISIIGIGIFALLFRLLPKKSATKPVLIETQRILYKRRKM